MNKTRLDLFPDGFPRLEDLKNPDLERLNPMSLKPPHDLNTWNFDDHMDFIEAFARLGSRPDFFVGRDIEFPNGYETSVHVRYYLFNDRIAFNYSQEIKMPDCPICKRSRVYMRPDGSFGCIAEDCRFHLPAPVQYNDAMEEKARMLLRDEIKPFLPMTKQRIDDIDSDLIPYIYAIFRELEIEVTLHDQNEEGKHRMYFELKKGFDIGKI